MSQRSEMVTLVSEDGKELDVNKEAIKLSGVISGLLEQVDSNEDDSEKPRIPIPGVKGHILEKVFLFYNILFLFNK